MACGENLDKVSLGLVVYDEVDNRYREMETYS